MRGSTRRRLRRRRSGSSLLLHTMITSFLFLLPSLERDRTCPLGTTGGTNRYHSGGIGGVVVSAVRLERSAQAAPTDEETEEVKRHRHSAGDDDGGTKQAAATETDQEARARQEQAAILEKKRLARERQFQKDLAKMSEDQRKRAQRKKKSDAAKVRRILRLHERGDKHYALLGLRHMELKLGPWFTLFRPTPSQIKRAYRRLSLQLHPDKNADGRAEEAFHALEHSARILLTEDSRREYDDMLRRRRVETRKQIRDWIGMFTDQVSFLVGIVRKVVQPFATPLVVLGALIV